jgi:predicted CopG family antitoxin
MKHIIVDEETHYKLARYKMEHRQRSYNEVIKHILGGEERMQDDSTRTD